MKPDFNKLIPELKKWNNGNGISVQAWIGFKAEITHVIGYSALFWPEFIEHKNCIFFAPEEEFEKNNFKLFFNNWFKTYKGNKVKIEAMMNHRHMLSLLGSPDINTNLGKSIPTVDQIVYFGRFLKEVWACKLKRDFPKRKFVVKFYEKNNRNLCDYEITFYQKRLRA